jgi:cytochrome d ubiquinol oxidase subunit II
MSATPNGHESGHEYLFVRRPVLAGVVSIVLLVARRYGLARVTSALAVATILIGWAVAQYPYLLLPYLTIEEAARGRATLVAMTVALILGSVILVPALVYMFVLFSRTEGAGGAAGSGQVDPPGDETRPEVGGGVTGR